jgi:hypothetical protein
MGLGSGKTNKVRRLIGGGPRPDKLTNKRTEAVARNEDWSALSAKKQLGELDRRLGRGIGAHRQRARLSRAVKAA